MSETAEPLLIIDVETTCFEATFLLEQMEIIEVGAAWVNGSGKILSELQFFVKPIATPQLSPFCKRLTGISQENVDEALPWALAIKRLEEFVRLYGTVNSGWGSWGEYDRKQIALDCSSHAVDNPLRLLAYVNLKARFAKERKIKQVGMIGALRILGYEHIGDHHRALSDVRNIAKILPFCRRV